eukprot:4037050-Amphidinium_carterae.1
MRGEDLVRNYVSVAYARVADTSQSSFMWWDFKKSHHHLIGPTSMHCFVCTNLHVELRVPHCNRNFQSGIHDVRVITDPIPEAFCDGFGYGNHPS